MSENHDVHSVDHYRKIYYLLLVLFLVSVAGPWVGENFIANPIAAKALVMVTAFGIAIVKAYYVCKEFMHLNVQPRFVVYMLGTMLAFVALFFAAVAPDVMKHDGQNWTNAAAKAEVERGMAAGDVDHSAEGHAGDHGGDGGH
jgi:caa(3)-type oxidase subunit IV